MNKRLKEFKKDLKNNGGHYLDCIAVTGGIMVYYREYGSFATDVKVKTILK